MSGVNVKLTNGLEKMLALNIIMKEKFQLDQLLEVQNLEAKLQDQRSMFRSKISSIEKENIKLSKQNKILSQNKKLLKHNASQEKTKALTELNK